MKERSPRFQIWSAYLGNFFEHYDKALFTVLAPFLAPLFFPHYSSVEALMYTYAILPIGMLARPIGALVFGYIGDVQGRGRALTISLFGMGLVSGSVALIPSYGQIGWLAPFLFTTARFMANFLSAGETMGGALFVLENSGEKKHDLLSAFYNSSTLLGYLVAAALVSVFAYYQVVESSWRLLYIFGAATAFVGTFFRMGPKIEDAQSKEGWCRKQFGVIWENRGLVGKISIVSGFYYSCYVISLVFMNGFIPEVTSLSKEEVTHINTLLMILDFFMLPLFGILAHRITREALMGSAAIFAVALGIPLFSLLEGSGLITAIAVRIVVVMIGVAFSAPFHAWTLWIVPKESRYTILSIGYALGTQLFGGTTAAISLWLYHQTGILSSAAWYWMALALCSCIVIVRSAKYRLYEQQPAQ